MREQKTQSEFEEIEFIQNKTNNIYKLVIALELSILNFVLFQLMGKMALQKFINQRFTFTILSIQIYVL